MFLKSKDPIVLLKNNKMIAIVVEKIKTKRNIDPK